MKKFFLIFLFTYSMFLGEERKKVYLIEISGEIDLGLAPYVERVVKEANSQNSNAIVLIINTFGGRVDAAVRIRDAILNSKVLTISFVNNRAISAGALITISAKKIAMVPASTLGAATVVTQTGEKAPEKYQSYMRSEMRATAQKNNRRADVAEAMVDEKIIIKDFPELDDSTKLLTLTSDESLKLGYCDYIVSNLDELLEKFGLSNAELISTKTNWAEDVVRFLSNPIVSGLLIMLGILGLLTEIKTPGWGIAGTVGLVSLLLFFGTNYILALANIWEILLFILGLILLLIELFYLPGFGIAGITGIILMIGSIFLGLIGNFPTITMSDITLILGQISGALITSLILLIIIEKFLPQSKIWNKLILVDSEKVDEGFVSIPDLTFLKGQKGKAITPLRPAGIALINGKRYDVITDGEFITQNSLIEVVDVEGLKVKVREIK